MVEQVQKLGSANYLFLQTPFLYQRHSTLEIHKYPNLQQWFCKSNFQAHTHLIIRSNKLPQIQTDTAIRLMIHREILEKVGMVS